MTKQQLISLTKQIEDDIQQTTWELNSHYEAIRKAIQAEENIMKLEQKLVLLKRDHRIAFSDLTKAAREMKSQSRGMLVVKVVDGGSEG